MDFSFNVYLLLHFLSEINNMNLLSLIFKSSLKMYYIFYKMINESVMLEKLSNEVRRIYFTLSIVCHFFLLNYPQLLKQYMAEHTT